VVRLEPLFLTAGQVSLEAQRLANELRDFCDRVLPQLVEPDRPVKNAFAWAATTMANNADALAWSVAARPEPIHFAGVPREVPSWDQVEKAVRAARASQHPTAQMHLLRDRSVTDEELTACRWDGRRVVWSLWAMVMPWPVEVLDERSRAIAGWLNSEASNAGQLRQLLCDLPARRLRRAFRRMPFDLFFTLAETLVRVEPAVPDAVLLVRTGRYGPAASAWPRRDVRGLDGSASHLLGAAMEIRANNHFGLVWRTALRPETLGNRRVFMPGQVLDILYRKWQVLHRLADQGAEPTFIVPALQKISGKREG
jgi:hypothetical protein